MSRALEALRAVQKRVSHHHESSEASAVQAYEASRASSEEPLDSERVKEDLDDSTSLMCDIPVRGNRPRSTNSLDLSEILSPENSPDSCKRGLGISAVEEKQSKGGNSIWGKLTGESRKDSFAGPAGSHTFSHSGSLLSKSELRNSFCASFTNLLDRLSTENSQIDHGALSMTMANDHSLSTSMLCNSLDMGHGASMGDLRSSLMYDCSNLSNALEESGDLVDLQKIEIDDVSNMRRSLLPAKGGSNAYIYESADKSAENSNLFEECATDGGNFVYRTHSFGKFNNPKTKPPRPSLSLTSPHKQGPGGLDLGGMSLGGMSPIEEVHEPSRRSASFDQDSEVMQTIRRAAAASQANGELKTPPTRPSVTTTTTTTLPPTQHKRKGKSRPSLFLQNLQSGSSVDSSDLGDDDCESLEVIYSTEDVESVHRIRQDSDIFPNDHVMGEIASPKNVRGGGGNGSKKISVHHGDVQDLYTLGGMLGKGTFCSVFLGTHKKTQDKVAAKVFNYKPVDPMQREQIRNEVNILSSVKHPHIVELKSVFETDNSLCVVMDLVGGGELFEYISDRGALLEHQCTKVMKGLLEALAHLHSRCIVHRDVKLENLLLAQPLPPQGTMESAQFDFHVKLGDFGLARRLKSGTDFQEVGRNENNGNDPPPSPGRARGLSCVEVQSIEALERRYSVCGSFDYVAPEVFHCRGYGLQVDVWSAGVVNVNYTMWIPA
jgi:tRNA A-37 threonylcarbamoyl transferase component Bud32